MKTEMSNNMVLSGDLSFLSLADLLQLLGSSGSTGILRIKSKYVKQPGLIYLCDGNPVNASGGESAKVIDALFAMFGWTEGTFEFSKETVPNKNVIKKSRMEIILDSLRLLDDGKIKKLASDKSLDPNKTPSDSKDIKENINIVKGPLVDYMYVVDEEYYHDQQKIVAEGKYGGWMWVILDGKVDIIKEIPNNNMKILTVGEGAFIGSISAFQVQGNIRSASTIAKGDVQLGVLDSQRLSIEFSGMNSCLKEVLISLDNRLRQITDRSVDIYLKKDKPEELIKGKKLILKQGEGEKKLFAINKGEAVVIRNEKKGNIHLAKLKENDCFGNLPFLDIGHEPFNASVYASDNIDFRPLEIDAINEEFNKLSLTFRNIIKHLASCISATTLIACRLKKF